MFLTGNELAAASSAVAAFGIIGGYLGVKSANRNALRIAREERSARRREELNDLKRATYARFLAALTVLAAASAEQEAVTAAPEIRGQARLDAFKKRKDALTVAGDIVTELDLLASGPLPELAKKAVDNAGTCTAGDRMLFSGTLAELRAVMRQDLQTAETSNVRGLDPADYAAIAAAARESADNRPSVEPSAPAKAPGSHQAGAPNTPR
jgi:hypothetical protein